MKHQRPQPSHDSTARRLGRRRALRLSRMLFGSIVALASLGPAPLAAQTVSNPRVVEFVPSADHAATLGDGSAAVTQYVFELYLPGAPAPFHTIDMAKPAPQSDGFIRFDFSSGMSSWALPGTTYESRVAAVGPQGTGRSAPSNQFTFATSGGCTFAVTPLTASIASAGGSTAVSVTTTSGCAWTATSSASWVTTAAAGGQGSSSVTLTTAANTDSVSRSATVTIAGQAVAVSQAAAPCTFTVSPTSLNVNAAAHTSSVALTGPDGCGWAATSATSWITVTPGTGNKSGTIYLNVAANTATQSRTGTVTAGGKTVSVVQRKGGTGPTKPKNLTVAISSGSD